LRVKADATLAEIHSAYIELIKQYHPDLVASLAPEYMIIAERETKILNAAYKEGQLSHCAA
jgi:curved DNA-binding protein CbpA